MHESDRVHVSRENFCSAQDVVDGIFLGSKSIVWNSPVNVFIGRF